MSTIVAPSLLAADFLHLNRDIEMLNRSEADWIHLDIMDGVFVPNISFGFPVINQLRKITLKPLDAHLMIVTPEKFIDEIAAAGATYMNVHYEACPHLHRIVQEIRKKGMKPAVTLNPHTPLSLLEEILPDLEMVLLMSVNPGFGGQQFIEGTIRKVAQLREMIAKRNSSTLIEVDGGINLETGRKLVDAGADVLVAGSFVFSSDDPIETIRQLKAL
ncbi:MAG: ribulose-phosphate 3-epimerase [Proteiniphilum sp.]|jgi:ribulose-phosphate 3-epimerase|nr:ribulose-phosphate 3-epimerase [Proteiniphilum sp.]NCD14421.1 ribulose-phosphate 3-epimerase [Bacteroidia bacterium]HHT34051.1 ribulose-phosphate 3-epimerase [Bacteroidales bacterium]MDD2725805.1 ribulose-phosphate 3-epimerase [Proteiniphilum sp.]MDD3331801.1 ribulose-phosphate 3-epimerase [Proteiniphilum sp.]